LRHGVRSCFEYQRSGDLEKARAASNPELSPHLSFVDMGGHGYAVVLATRVAFETEFVCIPRPLERSDQADGGAVLYRARFRASSWQRGESPQLHAQVTEGNPRFSIG
jgi:alkaline phosphatase D